MKNKKLWFFIGIVIVILILNRIFGWSDYIGNMDNLVFMEKMVEENIVTASIIYIVLTAVGCVVLALPGVTFAILAGLLFGPVLGTLLCSVATTIGAMAAFLAGRFFLQDSVKPMVMKNQYLKKWLFDEKTEKPNTEVFQSELCAVRCTNAQSSAKFKREIFILMITRLVPLFPYNLQNFAYGITDIKFSTYSICSLVFMLPGTAMYTVGTAGLADAENRFLYIGIAAVLAAAVMGLGAFFKKKYIGAEEENETTVN